MGKRTKTLSAHQINFIEKQKVFFVGTAASTGSVNISPKGLDSLRITANNQIVWLNLTGSGNETAAHLIKNDRMTLMFCAFEGSPMILRTYGKAQIFHPRDSEFQTHIKRFPKMPGPRQIIILDIQLVQTSCGFAVPIMDFQEDRSVLHEWSNNKGAQGIQDYQQEKNSISLDGFDTGINL